MSVDTANVEIVNSDKCFSRHGSLTSAEVDLANKLIKRGVPPSKLAEQKGMPNAKYIGMLTGVGYIKKMVNEKADKPFIAPTSVAEGIIKIVCKYYDVSLRELSSERKEHAILIPRCAASYLLHRLAGWSTTRIGRKFNRDHTTVLRAIYRAKKLVPAEHFSELRSQISAAYSIEVEA